CVVAMLPLVVATTVVQGGVPGLRIEDAADPNELPGLTPEQVHVVPEAHPLHGAGLLTWRNVLLGGVSSAALMVTSVVAYMTMWALGIGPVGSLLAQGVLEERDVIALRHFQNQTRDPSLAALLTDAFEEELSRAWVVPGSEDDAPPAKLVVSGIVSSHGPGYRLASSISSVSGSVLARFEEAAPGAADLVPTIERLSERVRERLGESLRSIREGERLVSMTTTSDQALELYRRASRASGDGDLSGAMDLLDASLTVDPAFAVGWRQRGVWAAELGDTGEARRAYQKAVDLWSASGRADRTVQRLTEEIAALE
ncbi:MAG: hypothetical protein PVH96_10775, partial [Gemmatimonadota bacterium]